MIQLIAIIVGNYREIYLRFHDLSEFNLEIKAQLNLTHPYFSLILSNFPFLIINPIKTDYSHFFIFKLTY